LEDVGVRFRPWTVLLVGAAALLVGLLPIPGLAPEAHRTLAILTAVTGLWVTESLPVAVTALFIPALGLILGVVDARAAFAPFGDPIVFLFFGTFLLTGVAERHGLTERLARSVLGWRWVAGSPRRLLWAVGLLGCTISAWVNNTATTAMLLPLALAGESRASRRLLVGTLLVTAYAPSLGGLATPVGTAPNLIGLRLLEEATGSRPSFAAWCALFAPLALLATAVSCGWLDWLARRGGARRRVAVREDAVREDAVREDAIREVAVREGAAQPQARRPWSLAERTLVPLFALVVGLWITPGILAATPLQGARWLAAWQTRLPETAVPLLGALLLFMLPSGAPRGARILTVDALRRVDWSTLLLFGGGLALGGMMFQTGLARALGEAIFHAMPIQGLYGVVLAATLAGVLMSEMTSNTASAALVVPVVLALAQAAGVDPVKPALAATVACSFGFMFPISTPPNALVYGTGRVPLRQMILHGVVLDVIGILLVSAWVTLVP
jgi:sodium-dependent dicarboxylate transporter 2/3/5